MNDTQLRILRRKHCISFAMEGDDIYYVLKAGRSNPQMYIVINDTPYDAPKMENLTVSEVAELLGVSEMAIEIGLS